MTTVTDHFENLTHLEAERTRLGAELKTINDRVAAGEGPPSLKERGDNLIRGIAKVTEQIQEAQKAAGRAVAVAVKDGTLGYEHADGARKDSPYGGTGGAETKLGDWLAHGIKAWVGSGTTGGGAFTPTEYARSFFDHLSAQSVGLASGFNVIRTTAHELKVPRLLTDSAASWTSEGATITPSDATADELTATPRKLAVLQQMSREVVDDSNPRVLEVAARQMVRSLALRLDLGFFEGSGTAPEIRGLKNTSGTGSVSMGTNGAALANLDPFADAIGALAESNAAAGAIVMHPRTWKALLKLKEQTTGNNKPLLQESAGAGTAGIVRSLYGVPVYLSSQLSITETQGTATNATSAYVYEPEQVVAVLREDTRVETDYSRLFNSDQVEVRAILRADLVVPNPAAVVRIAGIIP